MAKKFLYIVPLKQGLKQEECIAIIFAEKRFYT
mgnify:CR=1 FL=1